MKLSSKAENIWEQINTNTKLGDLRNIAKDIKKDHVLDMELWSSGKFLPRQLAILRFTFVIVSTYFLWHASTPLSGDSTSRATQGKARLSKI